MKQRERWPDFLRAASIICVVVFHAVVPLRDGLHFIPRMGFLFAIGALFIVGSLDRSWTTTLYTRSKRLLIPLWAFVVVVMPILALGGWMPNFAEVSRLIVPYAPPTATGQWADVLVPLWFITVYLWFVLASPLLLWAFRRAPYLTTLAPIVLLAYIYADGHDGQMWALLGDTWAFTVCMILVHLPCWMVGFARREGMLQAFRWRTILSVSGVLLGAAVLITLLKGDSSPAAFYPVYATYMLGFTLIVMRANPKMDWLVKAKLIHKSVRFTNQRAMTTYIWHFLVMSLVGTYIIWPHFWKLGLSPDLLALVSNVALVALTVTALTIPWLLFGWIEDYAANRKLVLWPGIRFPRPIRHARSISTYREAQAQKA